MNVFKNGEDLDALTTYPSGTDLIHFAKYSNAVTGTRPFPDGFLITLVWANVPSGTNNYILQIGLDDDTCGMKLRSVVGGGAWSAWKNVSMS